MKTLREDLSRKFVKESAKKQIGSKHISLIFNATTDIDNSDAAHVL